jgi:hypothetical protein
MVKTNEAKASTVINRSVGNLWLDEIITWPDGWSEYHLDRLLVVTWLLIASLVVNTTTG